VCHRKGHRIIITGEKKTLGADSTCKGTIKEMDSIWNNVAHKRQWKRNNIERETNPLYGSCGMLALIYFVTHKIHNYYFYLKNIFYYLLLKFYYYYKYF
jgi:hypothetical protein